MKVTIVGCTGSMAGPDSPASCYLVQAPWRDPVSGQERTYSIVLDLGSGAFGALQRHMDPKELDAVVFSHLHPDHMVDISGLYVYRRWYPQGRLPSIDVWGPQGTAQRIKAVDGGGEGEDYTQDFTCHDIHDQLTWRLGPFMIQAFSATHPVEAYCLRITQIGEGDSPGKVLAYSGDTDSCEGLLSAAQDADLFLCEVGFASGQVDRGIHLDGTRAGTAAREAQVKRMLATHIQVWADKEALARVIDAEFSGAWEYAHSDMVINLD
ncbi:MAG: MBL fold metallo-hydrolase [Actinomycetaceae bacterium]|nr:MBL fold metallo-hydrolase [Actinomycetaceae bacterium]